MHKLMLKSLPDTRGWMTDSAVKRKGPRTLRRREGLGNRRGVEVRSKGNAWDVMGTSRGGRMNVVVMVSECKKNAAGGDGLARVRRPWCLQSGIAVVRSCTGVVARSTVIPMSLS
jgi:hypothetical protein